MPWLTIPLLAAALDLWLKDPPNWPHPVRLIGWLLDRLERLVRSSPLPPRLAGLLCVLGLALGVGFAVRLIVSLPMVGWFPALYLSYAGLALGGLLQEGRRVARLLREQDVEAARTALAGLVSRDVEHLDENGIRRALAETVSENLNDAFTAPFFYLAFLGPAGLWAYKTVSTMDSMWGYKTPRWRELGWAAARADDLLAFVPARLTALALTTTARLLGRPAVRLSELRRTASLTESPNAGWPMAAAALALRAGMGGPTSYFGQIKAKPWLGPEGEPWTDQKLNELLRLALLAGLGICATLVLATVLVMQTL
ncbi:adenosylcobinamide-phosphate synthase CbiB [Desulfonatronum sp. SC1]|uniref:adenosylcobinamide-phosphate synthase CbiB n=1 Tax=Desulfonatronum sp. SC1 TaxID=2109626 RepID=UPI000D31010B|nr:adenosylcobinamide-phosphate synthase CbiB [Desulfonatronum sp. SC1]PTN32443.1 cobalamin biosynthesis protein CobD [Desulfonatronum sp. SC1]